MGRGDSTYHIAGNMRTKEEIIRQRSSPPPSQCTKPQIEQTQVERIFSLASGASISYSRLCDHHIPTKNK